MDLLTQQHGHHSVTSCAKSAKEVSKELFCDSDVRTKDM